MTSLSELNADPDVRRVVDAAACAFLERFSVAHAWQQIDGGPAFEADVWYRLAMGNSGPIVTVTVFVEEPVYGLNAFVAEIATHVAERFDWFVTIRTAVRLADERDVEALTKGGWRHQTVHAPDRYPTLSLDPHDELQSV